MKKENHQHLNVFYEDILVGVLKRDPELVYSFTYSKDWPKHPKKFQLSLAMPFQEQPFGNRVTLSFFENLLPEGEARDVLEKSRQIKGTFDFLDEFGADCAGAVIITHESVSPFTKGATNEIKIDKAKIYEAIKHKKSVAEVIADMDPGYLSIAGAQDKFTARFRDNEFYLPTNGRPTTHIIKPPIHRAGVKESVYNEHYCMKLAKAIGFKVSNCIVLDGDIHPLFITERYDRIIDSGGNIHRIHQQDFCQAQGIVSDKKYEEKGGPTLKDNYKLIKSHVTIKQRASALFSYLDWICFNLLIGNNDCHSKNLSFLSKDDKIELAPFYDLMCTAIYQNLKRNFSFNIGDRNDASRIGKNQLEMVDSNLGLKVGTMTERMLSVKDKLMAHKDLVANTIKAEHPNAKIVPRISELIGARCKSLKRQGLS